MKKIKLFLLMIALFAFVVGCSSDGNGNGNSTTVGQDKANGNGGNGQAGSAINLANYTQVPLTEAQKYSLAYMWHEEKLAKEIYLELYKINPAQQLQNIANNSEVVHIQLVQNLVAWYDINITNLANYEINYSQAELDNMPTGVFAVPQIQDLYNSLYDRGSGSTQASLEVGCMVEVVDIVDLDKYINQSAGNQALLDTFGVLRSGSYTHYWAFDSGLKNMGVTDGCCSLGAEYCHPEYPQN